MKKVIAFFAAFLKSRNDSFSFSDAIAEGLRDVMREMGYKPNNSLDGKTKRNKNED